jgi:hypothetical protein
VHVPHAIMFGVMCLASLSAHCKQQSKEDLGPAPVAPAPLPPPAPTQSVAPPSDTIPPPMPPPPTAPASAKPPDKGGDAQAVKACCAALRQEQTQVPDNDKGMYRSAANSCDSILKLVTAGTTNRSAAFASIRAALRGGKLPASCR